MEPVLHRNSGNCLGPPQPSFRIRDKVGFVLSSTTSPEDFCIDEAGHFADIHALGKHYLAYAPPTAADF